MHLKRWLTGVVAVPLLIYIIGFGPRWVFHLLVLSVALTGLREFYGITAPSIPRFIQWSAGLLTLMLFVAAILGQTSVMPAIVFLWAAAPLSYFVFRYAQVGAKSTGLAGTAILAAVYLSLPLSMLILMDALPNGKMWIFFLLLVVFAGDTGAFYFGRLFGTHRLHPLVSPGKTWEGAVGGAFCSVLAAFVFFHFAEMGRVGPGVAVLSLCISVFGQMGDLAESMLKRNHGVKDSGGILPGHGGILDRIDGVLFAIPVLYLYLQTWCGG